MNTAATICYVWLYTSKGIEALPQLAQALSILSSNVIAGLDEQAVAADIDHLCESGITHYPVQGDFLLSCDIRLAGWTLPDVKLALLQLSKSGIRLAMSDDTSDSPFASILFESGQYRAVTMDQDDETGETTLCIS